MNPPDSVMISWKHGINLYEAGVVGAGVINSYNVFTSSQGTNKLFGIATCAMWIGFGVMTSNMARDALDHSWRWRQDLPEKVRWI